MRTRRHLLLAAAATAAVLPLRAQDVTRAVSPPAALTGEARRLDSLGLEAWRRYEGLAHAARLSRTDDATSLKLPEPPPVNPGDLPLFDRSQMRLVEGGFGARHRHDIAEMLKELAHFIKPEPGRGAYLDAVTMFREAQRLDSASPDIRRHIYRALVEKEDWPAVLAEATRALRANPAETQSWLARGLALHRQDDYPGAAEAFEKAVGTMSPPERERFESMFRVLTPRPSRRLQHLPDSASFAALSPAERERWRQLFWAVADPRPSTRLNEALLEFQARLAYADLRWTNEIGQRGVETDKGDVHVRYGPPDVIYGVNRMNVWTYRNGDVFFFTPVANHFGRRLAQFEEFAVDSIKRERPVAWDNMPLVRRTWPMRVRVARFRATADSMDAIVAAAVPVRSFLGDAELQGRFPIDVTLDVADAAARVSGVEKRQVQVAKDSLPVAINGWWTRRVGAGLNVVRVDAQQADVERFALGTADAVVDSTTGFGMSDVLLGLAPRVPDGKAPERWTDVTMTPTVGVFPHRSPLGLVWETYDLAPQNDNVTYTVTLELERTFQRNLAGFVARIAGNLQNLVTRDGSGTGKISVTFQQTRRAAPVVTDYLSVDLDGSVTGPYRLRLTVRDNVTGRTVTRTADFHLTQD